MALKVAEPFTPTSYYEQVGTFLEWLRPRLVECVWSQWLSTYSWQGQDANDGVRYREDMSARLRSALANHPINEAVVRGLADEICEWGGMGPLGNSDFASVFTGNGQRPGILAWLESIPQGIRPAAADFLRFAPTRIATVTKMYEMYDPDRWIIYDSRSSRGLEFLVQAYAAAAGPTEVAVRERGRALFARQRPFGAAPATDMPHNWLWFPHPAGRGAHAARPLPGGFPTNPTSTQGHLAFVYGSWLAQWIATRLGGTWRAYHVEMVLFMLGGQDLANEPIEAIFPRAG